MTLRSVKRPSVSGLARAARDRAPGRLGNRRADGTDTETDVGGSSGSGSRPRPRPGDAMQRWRQFKDEQRRSLQESYRLDGRGDAVPSARDHEDDAPSVDPDVPHEPRQADTAEELHRGADDGQDARRGEGRQVDDTYDGNGYGRIGKAFNRRTPFYIGFTGALGVLAAYVLARTLGRLDTTLTILVVSIFLTLALNPIVERLVSRGVRRSIAVSLVCLGLLVAFGLVCLVVIPPIVDETTELVEQGPKYVENFLNQPWVKELDRDYNVSQKINDQVQKKASDGNFVGTVFGGVLGAGMLVVSAIFQAFTVLVLTIYLLAAFPQVKQSFYRMVPASRRPRVISLSEEVMRRTGGYAIGQVIVATINALCSWVMMTILGIPYPAVLAVVVGLLGLIPLVGATLGAVIVAIVGFFVAPKVALVVGIYYLIYQQIENYVIVPRVMARTVAVPGAITVVAALAGGTLFGVLGALLAIPLAAGLLLIYEEVLVPRQARS